MSLIFLPIKGIIPNFGVQCIRQSIILLIFATILSATSGLFMV